MDANLVQEMKETLVSKRDELTNRIEKLEANKSRLLDQDSEEAAVQMEDDEVADGLEEIEIKELEEVNIALDKIEKGTYGICEVSGKPIEENRLRAIPFARTCIEHAD